MSLAKLSDKCKRCPIVDKCPHKEMEALGAIPKERTAAEIAADINKSVQGGGIFSAITKAY